MCLTFLCVRRAETWLPLSFMGNSLVVWWQCLPLEEVAGCLLSILQDSALLNLNESLSCNVTHSLYAHYISPWIHCGNWSLEKWFKKLLVLWVLLFLWVIMSLVLGPRVFCLLLASIKRINCKQGKILNLPQSLIFHMATAIKCQNTT